MNERPILFNDAMVRAILAGDKTQTRRPVRSPPVGFEGLYTTPKIQCHALEHYETGAPAGFGVESEDSQWKSPFGAPGDKLWVRECWGFATNDHGHTCLCYRADRGSGSSPQMMRVWSGDGQWKLAPTEDPSREPEVWRPSVHMPRMASRITLLVKRSWAERVQGVSAGDIVANGIELPRECPHEWECSSPGRFGVGSFDDSASSACGGKPWCECFCAFDLWEKAWDSIYAKKGYDWGKNPLVFACEFELIETKK